MSSRTRFRERHFAEYYSKVQSRSSQQAAGCSLHNWTKKKQQRRGNQSFHIGFLHCLWTIKKLYGLSYTPGVLFSPAFGRHHCQKCLGVNAAPLMHRELHRSCKAARPSILCFHAGRRPSVVTITSLSTTIGRSQYPFSIVGKAVRS